MSEGSGAYDSRGTAKRNAQDYDGAIRDYDEAIRLDSKFALAHYNRGLAKASSKNDDGAVQDYDLAIRLNPNYGSAYYSRGLIESRRHEYESAIRDFNEVIRLHPDFARAYNSRGLAKDGNQDYIGAIQDYDEAIRLDSKFAEPCNNAAWLLSTCAVEELRNGRKAVANATTACELSSWKAWNKLDTLAAAYAEAGDFENAVKWHEKAVELGGTVADTTDSQERLKLYKSGKPYHEKPVK